jgi:drug/metabolite transporter (DMT)-like permease
MAVSARGALHGDRSISPALATDAMLLGMVLIWGINYSVVKYAMRFVSPLAFNASRVTLAAALFGVLAVRAKTSRVSGRDARALIALGMLGHGVYQLLFIFGLAHSRAGTTALVLAASPAFIGILGRLLGVEHIALRGWMGIALQIGGIALVVTGTHAADTVGDSLLGVGLLLAGALSWALFSILIKPYAERVSSVHWGALTLAGGALVVGIAGLPDVIATPWRSAGLPLAAAIVYSGALALVVAYIFWYKGLRALGPARVAIFGNLQPMIALVFAWVALGEVPTAWQWLGAVSIMGGLLISRL